MIRTGAGVNTRKSRKRDEPCASFQSSPKINRTSQVHVHHKTYLHKMKVFNTRPVDLFFSTTEVITCSKVSMLSRDRICGSTRFGKARYLSQLPIQCIAFVTPRFLSPVFTVSARNTWDHALARTHEKKKKKIDRNKEKKRNAYILRVSQLKQATLTSQFRPSPAGKLILKIKHFSYFILLVNSLLQFFRTFTKSTKEFTAVHCSSTVHFEIQRMQTASFA